MDRLLGRRLLRNPHFWVTVVLLAIVLLLYQAWPWRDRQFAHGFRQYFAWLSGLDALVLEVELPYQLFGVLFLVPIVYASLTISWPGGVFAWAVALAWVVPARVGWGARAMAINVILLLLPVLIVTIVALEQRRRETERRSFAERDYERQSYVAGLVNAQEAERHRIAREIHDGVLQNLMGIANTSHLLASSEDVVAGQPGSEWVAQEVLKAADDLRRLSLNLRPGILDDFGLVPAVRWLVNNANGEKGCQFELQVDGYERDLPDLIEVTVFRVVQEAIQNVQRHAHACAGSVVFEYGEEHLKLCVQDDGIGFIRPERLSSYATRNKLGIVGIEERVASVGGSFELDSSPGRGTTLSAFVPCATRVHAPALTAV